MRYLLATLAMMLGTSAFAAIPDTTNYTCQEVRDHVRRNLSTPLTFGGEDYLVIKDNLTGQSCDFSDYEKVQVFAPTLDMERCNVGFFCQDGDMLNKIWGGVLVIE